MPFSKVNGLELYYEETDFTRPWEAQPEVLVLLHGLHGHLQWWRYYQVAPFSQIFRVITPDFRGHGKSYKPATGYSMEIMASDVRELLRQLNVGRAHIGGASMGGMVTLQLALAHPEVVSSIILVDSYPHTPKAILPAIEKWISDTQEMGYARVMETFNDDYREALFSSRFYEENPRFSAFDTRLVLSNLMPDPAFIGCCQAILDFDVLDQLHEITVPALIITPNEGLAYEEGLRMAERMPSAERWTPEGVGHSVHVEIPLEFNRRVLDFLKQASPPRE